MYVRLTTALGAGVAVVLCAAWLAASATASTGSTAHSVRFEHYRLHVEDHPGREPAFVLMHGFPDNVHLYDRLVPYLRGHRVIAFDFLGWGRSGKPGRHRYTFAEQEAELDAVVRQLRLGRIIPVAHDASGPAAINWALAHRDSVAALVLLNTFYSAMPTVNPPEAIRIFSEPAFKRLAGAIAGSGRANHWLFDWQVGQFITTPRVRARMLSELWPSFAHSLPAFASLNRDLLPAVAANTARAPELQAFDKPVRIIFGARDRYLNAGIARSFHELLPTSDLFLLPARHYVQVDAPARVAALMTSIPHTGG